MGDGSEGFRVACFFLPGVYAVQHKQKQDHLTSSVQDENSYNPVWGWHGDVDNNLAKNGGGAGGEILLWWRMENRCTEQWTLTATQRKKEGGRGQAARQDPDCAPCLKSLHVTLACLDAANGSPWLCIIQIKWSESPGAFLWSILRPIDQVLDAMPSVMDPLQNVNREGMMVAEYQGRRRESGRWAQWAGGHWFQIEAWKVGYILSKLGSSRQTVEGLIKVSTANGLMNLVNNFLGFSFLMYVFSG